MTASSRAVRPRIVERKKTSAKRASKKRSRPRAIVRDMDLRDSLAMERAINLKNAGHRGRAKISNYDLGRYAAPLGGTKHNTVWGWYRNGQRHIPARDKLIFALKLGDSPGAIFPSFQEFAAWDILRLVLERLTAAEQRLLSELVGQFAGMTAAQREALLAKLKNF